MMLVLFIIPLLLQHKPMQLPEEETLRSCDHEDIGDIMLTLADSFNIPVNDMANIVTIGELTTLLQQYGNNHHTGGCTTQQAFYKVRTALTAVTATGRVTITPHTPLQTIITGRGLTLRKKTKIFQQKLGINVNIMGSTCLAILINSSLGIAALVYCFTSFKYAALLLAACIVSSIISKLFFAELSVKTAGELAKKLTEEHYLQARRHTGTINRQEIQALVQNIFRDRLALAKASLTPDEVLFQ